MLDYAPYNLLYLDNQQYLTLLLYGYLRQAAQNTAWFKSGLHLTVIPMVSSGAHFGRLSV
ncbi:MAG: hypothetical protein GY821_06555 [Gammaproteobacteria bacterium]|nr:hypothetical protein [Gammaproteobacteria bacterium]